LEGNTDSRWRTHMLKPRIPWSSGTIRPAEVGRGLCGVMMDRQNHLEDANYQRVVPNRFIVELSEDNFNRNYRPLGKRLLEQWRAQLVEELETANSRQGKREYLFGGPVQIEIRPAPGLKDNQARVLAQVHAERPVQPPQSKPAVGPVVVSRQPAPVAFLTMRSTNQRWKLYPGETTIGRDASCDITLDDPLIRERRLVSGKHAFIRCDGRRCVIYDGSPAGKPSLNGTFVNYQRVPPQGKVLEDGDLLILATVDPLQPQPDAPGVAAFYFWKARSESG